ncbi:MAG: hypothetical protein AB1758_07485, partial [Candidatus Eremiobacterota bacterium]
GAQDLQAHVADRRERDKLVDGMLETTGPGAPSAEEAEQLRNSLGVVDTGTLKFLQGQGLKLGVVSPGEDMFAMSVLREVDAKGLEQNLPTYRQGIDAIDARLDGKYGPQMAALEQQMQGLPADDPRRQKLDLDLARLQGQRTLELNQSLESQGIPARPLVAPLSAKESANQDLVMMATQVVEGPLPTSAMADIHGANTPERLQEFERLMVGLNGDRLATARQEGLEALKARVAAAEPEDRQRLQGYLDAALADPTQIPIDHRAHNIVVPDVHYADKGGQTTRLGLHDRVSLNNWGDGGSTAAPAIDPETGAGSVLNGQYFEDRHRILVRDTRVGSDTPLHELGHAVEGGVQRADPAFYADFEPRLMQAYEAARTGGTVSTYAQASPREYIAEGVAHYYEDPKALKATDPALFALTQELIQKASALGNG